MSPNTRVQAHGATLLHLRWMLDMFSLSQDRLMTAHIMPVIPTAHTAQRDFFFTKLFKGQSQQAFLICDAKIMWLKITIDFFHQISLASKVMLSSFFL